MTLKGHKSSHDGGGGERGDNILEGEGGGGIMSVINLNYPSTLHFKIAFLHVAYITGGYKRMTGGKITCLNYKITYQGIFNM